MELLIALLALTTMEVVLGIDNIVFISILSNRLPPGQQKLARRAGARAGPRHTVAVTGDVVVRRQ